MASNLKPWPNRAPEHEIRSIRYYLGMNYPEDIPPEMRTRKVEGDHEKPSIYFNLLTSRTEDDGQFHWYDIRTATITFFGSDGLSELEREEESMEVFAWLSEAFTRGPDGRGVVIPIRDFSDPERPLTGDYLRVESFTISRRQDLYELWTVPADISWRVSRTPVTPVGPIITSVERQYVEP